jgi:hypothetical protein
VNSSTLGALQFTFVWIWQEWQFNSGDFVLNARSSNPNATIQTLLMSDLDASVQKTIRAKEAYRFKIDNDNVATHSSRGTESRSYR